MVMVDTVNAQDSNALMMIEIETIFQTIAKASLNAQMIDARSSVRTEKIVQVNVPVDERAK